MLLLVQPGCRGQEILCSSVCYSPISEAADELSSAEVESDGAGGGSAHDTGRTSRSQKHSASSPSLCFPSQNFMGLVHKSKIALLGIQQTFWHWVNDDTTAGTGAEKLYKYSSKMKGQITSAVDQICNLHIFRWPSGATTDWHDVCIGWMWTFFGHNQTSVVVRDINTFLLSVQNSFQSCLNICF